MRAGLKRAKGHVSQRIQRFSTRRHAEVMLAPCESDAVDVEAVSRPTRAVFGYRVDLGSASRHLVDQVPSCNEARYPDITVYNAWIVRL